MYRLLFVLYIQRKQIQALEAREEKVLKKLSGRNQDETEPNVSVQEGSNKEMKSISLALQEHEQSECQRLIQTGQITPFDKTSKYPFSSKDNTHTDEINQSSPLTNVESASPHMTDSLPNSATDHFTTGNHTRRLSRVTADSLAGPSTSSTTPVWGVKRKRPSPTLQLSTDNFDGLFSEPSPPVTKRKRNSKHGGKSLKGKDKAAIQSNQQSKLIPSDLYGCNEIPSSAPAKRISDDPTQLSLDLKCMSSSSQGALNVDPLPHSNSTATESFSHGDTLPHNVSGLPDDDSSCVDPLPTTGSVAAKNEPGADLPEDASVEYDLLEDLSMLSSSFNGEDINTDDYWLPSIAELENFDSDESYESEYYTDDELGPVNEIHSKKKKTLRPLSSDEVESDDANSKRKKGKGRGKKWKKYGSGKWKKHLDDGDEELYRRRIQ